MLEVGERVDHRDRGRRGEHLQPLLLEGPQHDRVDVAGQDPAGVLDRLAAAELQLGRRQRHRVAAGRGDRRPRTRPASGSTASRRSARPNAPQAVRVVPGLGLDLGGQIEDLGELRRREVVDGQEVALHRPSLDRGPMRCQPPECAGRAAADRVASARPELGADLAREPFDDRGHRPVGLLVRQRPVGARNSSENARLFAPSGSGGPSNTSNRSTEPSSSPAAASSAARTAAGRDDASTMKARSRRTGGNRGTSSHAGHGSGQAHQRLHLELGDRDAAGEVERGRATRGWISPRTPIRSLPDEHRGGPPGWNGPADRRRPASSPRSRARPSGPRGRPWRRARRTGDRRPPSPRSASRSARTPPWAVPRAARRAAGRPCRPRRSPRIGRGGARCDGRPSAGRGSAASAATPRPPGAGSRPGSRRRPPSSEVVLGDEREQPDLAQTGASQGVADPACGTRRPAAARPAAGSAGAWSRPGRTPGSARPPRSGPPRARGRPGSRGPRPRPSSSSTVSVAIREARRTPPPHPRSTPGSRAAPRRARSASSIRRRGGAPADLDRASRARGRRTTRPSGGTPGRRPTGAPSGSVPRSNRCDASVDRPIRRRVRRTPPRSK